MSDYVDVLVNKLMPDWQIAPMIQLDDKIAEARMIYAEQLGLRLATHSGTGSVATADSDRFTDSGTPFSIADIGRYIVIDTGGANDGIYRIATFVDSSNVDCVTPDGSDPGFTDEDDFDWELYEEPSLDSSLSYMITQINAIIDSSGDWFQDMPRAFDPSDTDGSNTKNEKIDLKTLSDNWYGTKTKIIDVLTDPISVSASDTGALYLTSLGYADAADRRGLVIQASTGSYYDEVALASIVLGKHKVMLIDVLTDAEFTDSSGNLIYGVLQDGVDNGGSGEGTDVFIKFVYDNAGTPTNYTWTASDPANIIAYMPQRKRRTELEEYDDRRAFVSSVVGDAEQAEDIAEIRDALGIADGEGAGDWDLTNTGNYFPFSELGGSPTMEEIVNKLNEEIGNRDYTAENYVTDGQTITASIDALDQALAQAGIKSKIIERVSTAITKGTVHTIPFASGSNPAITTYKLDTGYRGLFMDVYVGGKKLVPDSGASATDGEYDETSNTQVTFRFVVAAGQIIEYIIKDNA